MRPSPVPAAMPAIESSASFRTVLELLCRAKTYAAQLQLDVWDFAVEIASLHAAGIDNSDLRLLTCQGYIAHAEESTPADSEKRVFRRAGRLTLTTQTCFVLTDKGLALFPSAGSPRPVISSVPRWDGTLRELRLAGELVKQFKVPAPNQELILSAFEEEGWPPHLDDPLPPLRDMCPKRRLNDAIHCLNRNQKRRLIRFHGSGNGRGLVWGRVS